MMSTEEKPDNRKKILRSAYTVASAAFFGLFFAYLFSINMGMNLNDPDVWWHLKTGEYVMEHREVPDQDPFSYTTPVPLNQSQKIGLRAHWLGQVVFALANKARGLFGVVVLRNLLIVMPMIMLLIWLLRRKVNPWEAFLLLSLPATMLCVQLFYAFERPQGLSFNLILIVAILLERVRAKSSHKKFDHSYWLLPLVATIWANMHAGYIVGNIVIVIYMVAPIAKDVSIRAWDEVSGRWAEGGLPKALEPGFLAKDLWVSLARAAYERVTGPSRTFYIVAVIALLCTGFNPNGYHMFWSYATGLFKMFIKDVGRYSGMVNADPNWVKNVVLEYKPLYYFYTNLEYTWLLFYWAFTAFTAMVLLTKYWVRRKIDLSEFLTVFFVVLFANMYARGIMFSLTVMPFYLAKSFIELRDDGEKFRLHLKVTAILAAILMVSFSTYTYKRSPQLFAKAVPIKIRHKVCMMKGNKPAVCNQMLSRAEMEARRPDRYTTLWYPNYLARFIKEHKPAPPMYNYYTWGGYLIYSLYPEYRMFIDGRALDNRMVSTADRILKNHPNWKSSLDGGYGINFIAIPVIFRESGHIIPLAMALEKDGDWDLVFLRNNSALFLRNRPIGSKSRREDWGKEVVPAKIRRNREIITKYGINKKNIYREILQLEEMFLRGSPNNPTFNISKADALVGLGQYKQARLIYDMFARYPEVQQRLQRLKAMGY